MIPPRGVIDLFREIPQTAFFWRRYPRFSAFPRFFLISLVCTNRVPGITSAIRKNRGKTTGIPQKAGLRNLSFILVQFWKYPSCKRYSNHVTRGQGHFRLVAGNLKRGRGTPRINRQTLQTEMAISQHWMDGSWSGKKQNNLEKLYFATISNINVVTLQQAVIGGLN